MHTTTELSESVCMCVCDEFSVIHAGVWLASLLPVVLFFLVDEWVYYFIESLHIVSGPVLLTGPFAAVNCNT